jgi:hypothetical protein
VPQRSNFSVAFSIRSTVRPLGGPPDLSEIDGELFLMFL